MPCSFPFVHHSRIRDGKLITVVLDVNDIWLKIVNLWDFHALGCTWIGLLLAELGVCPGALDPSHLLTPSTYTLSQYSHYFFFSYFSVLLIFVRRLLFLSSPTINILLCAFLPNLCDIIHNFKEDLKNIRNQSVEYWHLSWKVLYEKVE